jgi:hypothetical protein
MAFKGKAKGHDVVIATAGKLYDDSVKMFTEAEKKIDDANLKLDATIEEIDAAIAELQAFRDQAATDKERNTNFKAKLKEFTTL